jgi:hypothetical protein
VQDDHHHDDELQPDRFGWCLSADHLERFFVVDAIDHHGDERRGRVDGHTDHDKQPARVLHARRVRPDQPEFGVGQAM